MFGFEQNTSGLILCFECGVSLYYRKNRRTRSAFLHRHFVLSLIRLQIYANSAVCGQRDSGFFRKKECGKRCNRIIDCGGAFRSLQPVPRIGICPNPGRYKYLFRGCSIQKKVSGEVLFERIFYFCMAIFGDSLKFEIIW